MVHLHYFKRGNFFEKWRSKPVYIWCTFGSIISCMMLKVADPLQKRTSQVYPRCPERWCSLIHEFDDSYTHRTGMRDAQVRGGCRSVASRMQSVRATAIQSKISLQIFRILFITSYFRDDATCLHPSEDLIVQGTAVVLTTSKAGRTPQMSTARANCSRVTIMLRSGS